MTRTKWLACVAALAVALPFAAAAEEAPGWFKIPGTDSTIKFNGFAEMTYFYEFAGQTDLATAGEFYSNPGFILLDNSPGTKQAPNSLGFQAVYSRFGFTTNTPSSVGNIGVRVEGDFNHNVQLAGGTFTNKGDLRVRHAYGTVGDFILLGQTWSTFADLGTFPDQQDENPVNNLAPLRAPMVRLTFPAGPAKISLAAENPYAITGSVPGNYWNIPDFIARLEFSAAGIGNFSVRGVTRQFKNAAHSAQGFGGAVGAAFNFGGDSLVLDGSVGMGMGPYLGAGAFGDAVDTGTDIKLATTYGASIGYTHVWNPKFRSNLIASYVGTADNDDTRAAQAVSVNNKYVVSGVVNTYWSVAKNFWVGAEFWYNMRKTFGEQLGHEARGEITTHFDFM